jgi:nucleoid-associated protein YgaU
VVVLNHSTGHSIVSLISFIKDAGQKLFHHSEAAQTPAPASAAATPAAAPAPAAGPTLEELNSTAANSIRDYIESMNLGVKGLFVLYDGAATKVTVQGVAPTQEASEKVALCCGNVAHVSQVENLLTVDEPAAQEARYHDVAKGDTLSAISKKYYGDANKYMGIFEANKPMLTSPDKIYPGQKLRIPPQP